MFVNLMFHGFIDKTALKGDGKWDEKESEREAGGYGAKGHRSDLSLGPL